MDHKGLTYLFLLKIIAYAAFTGTVLSGCAVGPNFRPPEAPTAHRYTREAMPEQTAAAAVAAGETQRFVFQQDIPDTWWMLFHSRELDQLIRSALQESPTLAAAQANLRQAQEILNAGYGPLFPSVDASASVARQKPLAAASGQQMANISPFTLYNASVSFSYALDLFGGVRRGLESLQSQVDYQALQLEGIYLTLTSNIVTAAVKAAALRAQLRATGDIIDIQAAQLAVVERQFQLGAVSLSDVLAQKAQLAQTRATMPPLEKELAQTRHLLAVLTGRLPSEVEIPEIELASLTLPQELPLSLPSALVRQRPDIRAAEALMHTASAQVGVATANLYPQITLTGSYGSQAARTANLFDISTTFWSLGAGLLQPIFRGGELTAKRRAAIAAYDQASALYRETVLQAFQNVADVLRALEADARTLEAQADAHSAARDLLELTRRQFQLGAVNYLALLNAQRQYQQASIGLIQAQAARFADTAALFQALGGGWWNRPHGDTTAQKERE